MKSMDINTMLSSSLLGQNLWDLQRSLQVAGTVIVYERLSVFGLAW
jgi:hypothetical protein